MSVLDTPTETMAWWTWDNKEDEMYLMFLVTPCAVSYNDKYILPAWDSANGIGSYASNRLILKEF